MINLSESVVEEIAAKALGIDVVIAVGQDAEGHYLSRDILAVLRDVRVSEGDLRMAAEVGIHAYLWGQAHYIRRLVRDKLQRREG